MFFMVPCDKGRFFLRLLPDFLILPGNKPMKGVVILHLAHLKMKTSPNHTKSNRGFGPRKAQS